MLPLGNVIRKSNSLFHVYADDSQLYISLKSGKSAAVLRKLEPVNDFLQFKENEPEVKSLAVRMFRP